MTPSNLRPFSANIGLRTVPGNKATFFSVKQPIISTPECQTSSFHSEIRPVF